MLRYFALLLVSATLYSTAYSKELRYTVDLQHPETHSVSVTLRPVGYARQTMTFQMPAWAPGAYSLTHYGRYVQNIKAVDSKGHELPVTQLTEDRWSIANAKQLAEIRYDVLDSHSDSTSLYFGMANFDSSLVYANATALFGYLNDDKASPAQVTYLKPATWQLVTALPPTKKGFSADTSTSFTETHFYAKDYDVLADAPLMAAPEFQSRSFREGSAVYDIALVSQASFEMDSLEEYTRKIVAAETDFFHQTPFSRYFFIMYSPTMQHVPTFAQGALEHANASNYLLVNISWPFFKQSFLSVLSHEFFHLWDVKRIHSSKLGPFDYANKVETTSLWMAEGVTDYYAHVLLSRYGIVPSDAFFRDIQAWLGALKQFPSTTTAQSLETLSQEESDFDIANAAQFYIKGPLVAWMLDLEIRHQTQNKKSLDDVMLALNEDAKKGRTFKDEELIDKVEKYSGASLRDFYTHYIAGGDSLPIEKYLHYMGVHASSRKSGGSLSMTSDNVLFFETVDSGSIYESAGIQPGDRLIAVDGEPLKLDNIERFTNAREEHRTITVTTERQGVTHDAKLDFSVDRSTVKHIGPMEIDATSGSTEAAIRRSLLGSEG
jgi:predicted metalloprotease with PDZ domain